MVRGKKGEKRGRTKNGANLGFEQKLWQAADKLRGNMDAVDYKHVVLGLIFLKYISDAFKEHYEKLKKEAAHDGQAHIAKHGYPPDKQEKAAQTLLERVELLCKEWAA